MSEFIKVLLNIRSLKAAARDLTLEQLEEVRRFTKLIRLYARCPWLGKLYTDYYVHKGKIKA